MTVFGISSGDAVGGRGGLFGHFGGDGAGLETFDGQVDAEGELPYSDREGGEPGPRRDLVIDTEVLRDDRGEDDGCSDETQRRQPPGDKAGFVHQGAQQYGV